MLYIFHVDTGTTLTFDIKLALQSVAELQEAIERECGVLAGHQVLLMSGGESLEPQARVCSYSAGTDTNPIYLFSKAAIESQIPPTPHTDYSTDIDIVDQINGSLAMPATYATLVARAQLAQQCCAIAKEQTRTCERLVHDQHLQQQGWAAVVANLEDITQMFQSKAELIHQSFAQYVNEREGFLKLWNNFNNDLRMLSKIPILPALRAQAEGLPSAELTTELSDDDGLSLLKWISAKDNQRSLEQVAEQCSRGLEQFDERMIEALKNEVNSTIDASNKPEMKEIKGLGERLFALEQLMIQTKKLVQEQGELAQGFLQNQTRANNLGDPSILPDLCASHRRQLIVMMENHNQLRDIRRRCTRAKEELSININHRLKWIMYVEHKIMEVGGKLVMYHESLKRLKRHLEVLQQIHLAPTMYMNAVAEVVRRRTFSHAFLLWASSLSCQLYTVHSEEIARRREFQHKFDGHFLNSLFPGLEDTPPSFATQAPPVFDVTLPKLTVDDMESLKIQLPDLAESASTPDLNSITQFFLSKSLTEGSTDDMKSKQTSSPKIFHDRVTMTGDRIGFESETDTDEFEKIGQGVTDSKNNSYDDDTKEKLVETQMEVGGSRYVSPSSSISTNISSLNSRVVDLNRSSSSSDPGSFHIPNLSCERPTPLSPLTECVENISDQLNSEIQQQLNEQIDLNRDKLRSSSSTPKLLTLSSTSPRTCDGQMNLQLQQQIKNNINKNDSVIDSGGSSPYADSPPINADFMGTEFYMDESLPSSLSEHPTDGQHQAIVSLLQENLGNTRGEVERLRSILCAVKTAMKESISGLRDELLILRDKVNDDKNNIIDITNRVRQTLTVHSDEFGRILREREQELTIDHELELADAKKLMLIRDDEIRSLKQTILEKDSEFAEQEHLINTRIIRQNLDNNQEEIINLQKRFQNQLDEALEQARVDKENAVKQARDSATVEIAEITQNLEQCKRNVRELEESLAENRANQQKIIKEATDKIQLEYKTELETIRSRFKLMAASSVMERSPSDSSLEKIERPDVIELVNHEAILVQTKENMETEKAEAIQKAIEKETAEYEAKLQYGLQMATKQIQEELEACRVRESALLEECHCYRETILRLTENDCDAHQLLTDQVKKLEEEKHHLESKITAERKILKQRENQVYDLETERNELRVKMNQSNPSGLVDTLKVNILTTSKDDIEVSESKKSRLEAIGDIEDDGSDGESILKRLEILELDNKRLNTELKLVKENKEYIESIVDALEADNVRLEVELVKERSKRGTGGSGGSSSASVGPVVTNFTTNDSGIVSSIESRDKDMNVSVAVVSDSSNQDTASCSEQNRQDVTFRYRDKLIKYTTLLQQSPVSLHGCNPGQIVVVLWDTVYTNYIILQDSKVLYFLNCDCIDDLDLRLKPDGSPKQTYVFGEVIDIQYCHAKKSGNRYHVPRGTKFYRVRVKPIHKEANMIASSSKSQQ